MEKQTKTSTTTKTKKWTIQKILHNDITLRTVDRAADYSGVISTLVVHILYIVYVCVCICVYIISWKDFLLLILIGIYIRWNSFSYYNEP